MNARKHIGGGEGRKKGRREGKGKTRVNDSRRGTWRYKRTNGREIKEMIIGRLR